MTAVRRQLRSVARGLLNGVVAPVIGSTCPVCGHRTLQLKMHGVLAEDLAREWQLDPTWIHWVERRESTMCSRCNTKLRSIHLAGGIVKTLNAKFGLHATCLDELLRAPEIQSLKVAEINSIGELHPRLAVLPQLAYSEYGSTTPGVPDEDLNRLSYPDSSFDLVLTSETLEHVPDVDRALTEIRRILKPDGMHIFTVPIILAKPVTKQRATIEDGKLRHLAPPTYHGVQAAKASDYLVFSEFGRDFVDRVQGLGFEVELLQDEANQALVVFVTRPA